MNIGHVYVFGTRIIVGEHEERETHEGICAGEMNGVVLWEPLPFGFTDRPPRSTRATDLEFTKAVMPWTELTTDTEYREALARVSQ